MLSSGERLTLFQTTNFRLFQTKKLQSTILNVKEMAESSHKRVKSTLEKGEIARNEQFLLFPKWFQKTCTADM